MSPRWLTVRTLACQVLERVVPPASSGAALRAFVEQSAFRVLTATLCSSSAEMMARTLSIDASCGRADGHKQGVLISVTYPRLKNELEDRVSLFFKRGAHGGMGARAPQPWY